MITGSEKLLKCKLPIQEMAEYLDTLYGNIVVTSGYRSEEYNKTIPGASPNSPHCHGDAFDVFVPDVSIVKVAYRLLEKASEFPIRGMGFNFHEKYLHVDIHDRGVYGIVYWAYNANNVPV